MRATIPAHLVGSDSLPSFTQSQGWHLPHKAWTNNRVRSGVGRTQQYLQMIGAAASNSCECGDIQTINHTTNDCRIFKAPHGVTGLVELDNETVTWLMPVGRRKRGARGP